MRKLILSCLASTMTLLAGCGGGGESPPSIFTSTTYTGRVHDQRFGDYEIDVHIAELTDYPGRVSPQLIFTKLNVATGSLSGYTQVDVFEPTGNRSEEYLPLVENSFHASMGTWPEYVPVTNPDAIICHMSVDGKINPDLKPGSAVTISYSSSDCNFASKGSFVADYKDVLVHDAN